MGQRVGPYRLTGRIGQGGMGTVYRAVRDDDQFQQTVAVKMLRFPDGDSAMLQRFRRERQILASLEHPHIARLLDGGAWVPPGSAEPQPYIVMEYVEGLPLTTYCEQEELCVAERLRLFRRVCEAVSYAHRLLVVHRDIKPGNILVTADGTPKLVDFGVSKLLDRHTSAAARALTLTVLPMTPDYASPEQVRGESVSTLTDVYSLGAVLYELLTGRRPHQLATHDPVEIVREICECDAAPPQVNGELDLIVLKALQKEPARRYHSVDQFSEDIGRYLEDLPIIARPDTLAYRTMKFVRRRRRALIVVVALGLATDAGIGLSIWEAIRANREAATAKAVNEFLENDLLAQAGASAQSGPNTKPDPHLEVLTALDRAAARIGGKFAKQPLVEASIRQTISSAYKDLGLYRNAQQQMERALELRQRASGEQQRETLVTMTQLAELYWLLGERAKGEPLFIKTLDLQRRLLGEEDPDTLVTMTDLGTVYADTARYAQAESLYASGLKVKRRVLGAENPETLQSMHNLASVYKDEGKLLEAESLYSRVLEIRRRTLGEEHPDTLQTMNNMGSVYRS
ncbi:MAG: serine/threonine protein kinase, partial [Acidobacteriaceae bacterium]|nr:serine/threonine protein kinase [Acidobacteriaceae bacterium]